MSKFNTKKLITLSVLVAMDVVLTRFLSINAWNTRIGFGFVPMVIAAMMYGPLSAGIVAALADFIGAILFPTGPYFPGFTFSVFLMGIVFGLFLYKDRSFWRVVVSVLITQFVISLFLTTYWISFLYGANYKALLATRVVQSAIISAAQIIVIPLMAQLVKRLDKMI
ncbi:MAG: folate family ECF transporter S component [Oscillospiraceae bacterium]|jgi:ECF transporter S component (folate family)|nr:folate family ECF transporter S component [Oscillospiraceae bacterium]